MNHLPPILLLVVGACLEGTLGSGAGRAFPMESENLAIEKFQSVNPSIAWDPTNFLIDLSGQYANCKNLNHKGPLPTDRRGPEGQTLEVIVDTIVGRASDVDSVNVYIRDMLNRWMSARTFHSQIQRGKLVGCSIRPACTGNAVVACVFSDDKKVVINKGDGNGNNGGNNGGDRDGGRDHDYDYQKRRNETFINDPSNIGEKPKALAFTPQQYDIAENILGKKWDRSHFLEDLSGFETDCTMIGQTSSWQFNKVKAAANERKLKITGQSGQAPNRGSTPDALRQILSGFKPGFNTNQIGCSIIPDCMTGGSDPMIVVISCLYQEG